MNLGLGNLYTVKQQLLAEALRAGTKYDAALTAIAKGVAAQFEKYCNRKLGRVVGATCVCSADRDHFFLDRYPLEDVTSVDLKSDAATGWETQTGFVLNWSASSGHVYWGGYAGPDYAQLRFTFTGGFWFDETEENNDTLPTGATALPDDLKLAWLLQCREIWQHQDKLGINLAEGKDRAFSMATVEMLPQVKEILSAYRRYQLT